jgi:hypothetical protein
MVQVSQLYIYPIKSLGGISISSAVITDRGFEHDRRWMLVDTNNRFLTQRECAAMALLQVEIVNDGLKVFQQQEPGNSIHLPFPPYSNDAVTVEIWGQYCGAVSVNDEADKWFSGALNIPCRLVYMNEDTKLPVDERYAVNHDLTNFSDGFPILMISEASLADLNSRIEEVIPMNRFRPNLVITGSAAYEEDHMKAFVINGITLYGVKPSARCVITTINQYTLAKGKEPLKTLATYRGINNKIYFGENVIAANTGRIHIGDEIKTIQTKEGLF